MRRLLLQRLVPVGSVRCTPCGRRALCVEAAADPPRKRGALTKEASASAAADSGPFYSKYYKLGQSEVESYLKRHNLVYQKTGRHLRVKDCPFCHPTKGQYSNQYKLYVLASTGVYKCHRCGAAGSWFQLRKEISNFDGESPLLESTAGLYADDASADASSKACPPRASLKQHQANLNEKHKGMLEFIREQRGLNADVLAAYSVGLEHHSFRDEETGEWSQELCYMFPMFSSRRKLMRYKVRAVHKKRFMKLHPKGGDWGLFGFDALPTGTKEVVLTEGEFDAMAVYQATGRPALSLPNGASSLPVNIVHALERFQTIYLWMDDDIAGQDGVKQFAKKLGRNRCRVVQTNGQAKDANDALLKGLDLDSMIQNAGPVPHEGVATFKDFKNDVYNEIMHTKQLQGIQSKLLPGLTNILSGHRRGELTIFTGHTGSGKTTLLSQLSLDYCLQGVPTLWGSFEISNVRLNKLILEQFYTSRTGQPASTLKENFHEWAEKFQELPMFFMRYHGSCQIERVIDAMEYGNYVHDISHVLLDNLQFMTSGQGRTHFDRYEVMDSAIQKLRHFSSDNNAHVSLVVHPRKENDGDAIQTASVFGSAKATQEADNVVILQRTSDGGRLIDVKKNRFSGDTGSLKLVFDKERKLFMDKEAKDIDSQRDLMAPMIDPSIDPSMYIDIPSPSRILDNPSVDPTMYRSQERQPRSSPIGRAEDSSVASSVYSPVSNESSLPLIAELCLKESRGRMSTHRSKDSVS